MKSAFLSALRNRRRSIAEGALKYSPRIGRPRYPPLNIGEREREREGERADSIPFGISNVHKYLCYRPNQPRRKSEGEHLEKMVDGSILLIAGTMFKAKVRGRLGITAQLKNGSSGKQFPPAIFLGRLQVHPDTNIVPNMRPSAAVPPGPYQGWSQPFTHTLSP